jgi:hypothetical protein
MRFRIISGFPKGWRSGYVTLPVIVFYVFAHSFCPSKIFEVRQIPNLCDDEVQFTILTLLLKSSFPAGVEVSFFIQPVPNIDRLENFGVKNFKKGVETRK